MTETTAPETPVEGQAPAAESASSEPQTFDKEYVEGLRKEAAKYRTEAKAKARELETVRQATMSADEKTLAEAETKGRMAATLDFGKRLARTEFDALAGRRNPEFDTAPVFEYLDVGRLVGDDGEPDSKQIEAAVKRLIPERSTGVPNFDGGTRTSAAGDPAQDFANFLSRQVGRG